MAYQKIFLESIAEICGSKAGLVAAAYRPKLEASDGIGHDYDTLQELAMWLLVEANVLNQLHWNTDKNVKHELLNEAYELCRDTGDKLAETYIALSGKPCDKSFPKVSAGAGLKIAMNQNFIVSAEFAKCLYKPLDAGLWIGIGINYQF